MNPDQPFQQAEVLREEAELEVKSLEKSSQHDGNLWLKPPGEPGALTLGEGGGGGAAAGGGADALVGEEPGAQL